MAPSTNCSRRRWNVFLCASFLVLFSSGAQGFFIDLEALGFSTSRSGDSSSAGSSIESSPKILIAEPTNTEDSSNSKDLIEVESKDDPHKSVKLTLGELKQLVLGTVKDLTPNPPPINIQITPKEKTAASPTTTTARPKKVNTYRYKGPDSYEPQEVGGGSDDDSSFWKRPNSMSVVLPPFNDDDGMAEHYLKSNEVDDYEDSYMPQKPGGKGGKGKKGWFSAAKAVIKGPTHIMNSYSKSFSRFRGKPKKQVPRVRPIQDITYKPKDSRRRRKRPSPSRRRPHRRPSTRGHGHGHGHQGQGHGKGRRRPQGQKPSHSSYYSDDDVYSNSDILTSVYDDSQGHLQYTPPTAKYDSYDDWDRFKDRRGPFDRDSTIPQDYTPQNMSPPLPY